MTTSSEYLITSKSRQVAEIVSKYRASIDLLTASMDAEVASVLADEGEPALMSEIIGGGLVAKGVNKVILLGNVGRDPEIRATAGGSSVASLSLATADRRKGQDGQWEDVTEWHNLIAFGKTADVIRDYAAKGTQLHIVGKLQTRSWDDKASGAKKYRTEIMVEELTLLGGGKGGQRSDPAAQAMPAHEDYADDPSIPF